MVIKETKGLTLFIYKVDSRKCIFCGQNRMRKVKKLMMNNVTLSAILCLTLLNTNTFTRERLMLKNMSENDVVGKKLLTNQTPFTAPE